MTTSRKTKKERLRKHEEEVSTRLGSTLYRGSSDLGEDSKPAHLLPKSPAKISKECGTDCEVAPHPSPLFRTGKPSEQNPGRRKKPSPHRENKRRTEEKEEPMIKRPAAEEDKMETFTSRLV